MACLVLIFFLVSVYILIACDKDDGDNKVRPIDWEKWEKKDKPIDSELDKKPIDWDHWEKKFNKKVDTSKSWAELERYGSLGEQYRGKHRFNKNAFIRQNPKDQRETDKRQIDWKKWERAFDRSRGRKVHTKRTTRPTMSPKALEIHDWLKQTPLKAHNSAYFNSWAVEKRKRLNISEPESEEHNTTAEEYEDADELDLSEISPQKSELVENLFLNRKKRSPRKIEKYWNSLNMSGPVPTAPGVSLFYNKKNKKRAERIKYRSHIEMGKYLDKLEQQKKEKESDENFFKSQDWKVSKPVAPSLVYSATSDPETTTEKAIMMKLSDAEENQFLELFFNKTPKIGEDFLVMQERWSVSKAKFMKRLIKERGNRTAATTQTLKQILEDEMVSTSTSTSRSTGTTATTMSTLQQKVPYKQEAGRVSKKLLYCHICGWTFKAKYRLTQHIKSKSCLKQPAIQDYFKSKWK
uniref:C2H2-type domain-containing protein n=1 Tax=Cacopsylla melanoneura TaxID=428564 RepID=A0A8D9EWV7_9HEMI